MQIGKVWVFGLMNRIRVMGIRVMMDICVMMGICVVDIRVMMGICVDIRVMMGIGVRDVGVMVRVGIVSRVVVDERRRVRIGSMSGLRRLGIRESHENKRAREQQRTRHLHCVASRAVSRDSMSFEFSPDLTPTED